MICAELLPEGREAVPWSVMAAVLVIARLCEPSSELHIAEDLYRRTALEDLLGLPVESVNEQRRGPDGAETFLLCRSRERREKGRGMHARRKVGVKDLIACASLVLAQFPEVELHAFAVARVEEIELTETREMAAPKVERIRYDESSGWLARS